MVYALDARTGKELWRWDPEVNQTAVRPKICCGIVNRGIAIYNGMIIAADQSTAAFALDAITGKPVWESRVAYPQDLYTLTMAPRIAGGKVIIGASGGDKPTRGFFAAFDAMTGQQCVEVLHGSRRSGNAAGERSHARPRQDLGRRFLDQGRRRRGVGRLRVRSRREPGLCRHGQRRTVGAEIPRRARASTISTPARSWRWTSPPASSNGTSRPRPNDNWDFDSVQQLMLLDLTINGSRAR